MGSPRSKSKSPKALSKAYLKTLTDNQLQRLLRRVETQIKDREHAKLNAPNPNQYDLFPQ